MRTIYNITNQTTSKNQHLLDAPEGAPQIKVNEIITFGNGYLGSCDDEERSEMRYVMRIAELVNHQIFERTWRFS